MTLFIDIGNSRSKFWLVVAGKLVDSFSDSNAQAALMWLQQQEANIKRVIIASVRTKEATEQLLQSLLLMRHEVVFVSYNEALLCSEYENTCQLGIDRWLAALAAKNIRQAAQPVIIVDAGTAITLDVLSADGNHLGGYILPGLSMQVAALGQHTDKVQVGKPEWSDVRIGQNTQDCVSHGILATVISLIRHVKSDMEQEAPVTLYLTGGDAKVLIPFIPEAIYVQELVLLGLMSATKFPLIQGLVQCEV
ncbi:MAG: type III pantothenate kinase [Moraxellaceae bacterium]|nr:type III pantothenate kinase [Moraxellaceae bacterium]MDZ4386764.1 type III pantothenate kinase [Moraxellaceae bacterium]